MSDTLTRWRLDARKKAMSKTGEGSKPPLTGFEALVLEVFSNPNLPDGVRVRLALKNSSISMLSKRCIFILQIKLNDVCGSPKKTKKSAKKNDATAAPINDTIEEDDDDGVENSEPNYFESSMSMPISEWKKKQKEKASVDIKEFEGTKILEKQRFY